MYSVYSLATASIIVDTHGPLRKRLQRLMQLDISITLYESCNLVRGLHTNERAYPNLKRLAFSACAQVMSSLGISPIFTPLSCIELLHTQQFRSCHICSIKIW